MGLPYVVRQRENPMDREKEGLFYPASAYYGEVDIETLAKDIAESSSLTKADLLSAVQSIFDNITRYLTLGFKVRLGDLGVFRIGIKGKGQETAAEVTVNDIVSTKISFLADSAFKKKLKDLTFTKMNSATLSDDSEEEKEGESEETASES